MATTVDPSQALEALLDDADHQLATEIAGLDALERADDRPPLARRIWSATWPKLAAIAIALLAWQLLVWSGWRSKLILPPPTQVIPRLFEELGKGTTWVAIGTTLRRALTGFSIAFVIGSVVGLGVARSKVLRSAVGSLITGLQTMPSVAWFPLAVVLFKLDEGAIYFVVAMGAAPSIANGVISGVDQIPPIYLRAGRVLGARGLSAYRHVIVPAAFPTFFSGMKQGWAFAWRSLLAGELLVQIAGKPSIGSRLEIERTFGDYEGMIAVMIIILVIGIVIDAAGFNTIDRVLRRRRGLTV